MSHGVTVGMGSNADGNTAVLYVWEKNYILYKYHHSL